jgi:hypothetical protein
VIGAFDMISVYIREILLQLWTPDEVRGRVNAVNSIFLGASNELGEARAGFMAAFGERCSRSSLAALCCDRYRGGLGFPVPGNPQDAVPSRRESEVPECKKPALHERALQKSEKDQVILLDLAFLEFDVLLGNRGHTFSHDHFQVYCAGSSW